ncbi:MAG: AraC family transcriptional regulator [Eubacterium sp.]|nr:AraC family transcriptional regulator [Eubacterium sp.]
MFHVGYCDYNRSNPDYDKIDRPEGSGDYLFLYFMTPMKVQADTETIITKEGAFMLYTPGNQQIYQAVKRFKNSFVHFTCDDDDFVKDYDLPVNRIVYLPDPDAMNALLKNIYVESVGKQAHYPEQIDKLMHLLFILFSRQLRAYPKEAGIPVDLYEQFQKARIEILTHIDREWTSDNMAALTNLGTSQFYSYYSLFFNRSPKSELLDARIERSKYLLRVEKLPVGQAAAMAGFHNLSHFTRYFKKECGMTPTEYGREES